jgi:hypothetical protein
MSPYSLADLEEALRSAVKDFRYQAVQTSAVAFCEAAAHHIQSLPPQDPERILVAVRLRQMLNWALLMLRTGRALCLDELRGTAALQNYIDHARSLAAVRADTGLDL